MIRQGTIIRRWYDQELVTAPANTSEAVCCIRPSRTSCLLRIVLDEASERLGWEVMYIGPRE